MEKLNLKEYRQGSIEAELAMKINEIIDSLQEREEKCNDCEFAKKYGHVCCSTRFFKSRQPLEESKECCEKCYLDDVFGCGDRRCPCHKPKEKETSKCCNCFGEKMSAWCGCKCHQVETQEDDLSRFKKECIHGSTERCEKCLYPETKEEEMVTLQIEGEFFYFTDRYPKEKLLKALKSLT